VNAFFTKFILAPNKAQGAGANQHKSGVTNSVLRSAADMAGD
jgi:hypothetical protein